MVYSELTLLTPNSNGVNPQFTFVSDLGTTGTYAGNYSTNPSSPDNWLNVDSQDQVYDSPLGPYGWNPLTIHTPGGAFSGAVLCSGTNQTDADFVIEQVGGE
jgi:hypothetical protein